MLELNEIKAKLKGVSARKVADATGLHINTVMGVRDDEDCNPTYKVMTKLSDYFEDSEEHF